MIFDMPCVRQSKTLVAALALVCLAADARANASECAPLADAQKDIADAGGGRLKPISRDALLFARGLFTASPPVSPYPPGEDALIAGFPDGASTVVFVVGDQACGKMGVSPPVTKLLLEIDASI